MQQALWILQMAFESQQSEASLQALWKSTSVFTQHLWVSQAIPGRSSQQSEAASQPVMPVRMQHLSLAQDAFSLQQSVLVKQSARLTAQHFPPSQVTPEPEQHSKSFAQPLSPRKRQHV